MEGGKSAFKILTGTPIGKRPLGRPNIEIVQFNNKACGKIC
jgi:hypothetical protein